MARKLQLVSELANQTAHNITRDVDGWKQYLNTASRLYKYKFDEQLLIYAQRPDATACAEMELWNEKMRRWVKAGSKGIALIRGAETGRPHLEYVFDVADTRPVRGAREPYLWEMREEHYAPVLDALERRYGEGKEEESGNRLMEIAAKAVREVYPEYLKELAYDAEGSFLEEFDQLNLEVCFRNTLTASVQYTLLTRCGFTPSDYLDDGELAGITEFSTPSVLHHLGNAASTLSMGILQEIGKVIRNYDRELMANTHINMRQENIQKTAEKPLAKSTDIDYTKATEQFNTLKRESKERGIENGRTDIHEERGLPDTGTDTGRGGRTGGNANREVRDAAPDLPAGIPSGDVHIHAADGTADAPLAADRRTGTGAGRPDGGRDDESKGSGREPESARPDGVGTGGEQPDSAGGGSGASGDRVPVEPEGQNKEKEQETAGDKPAVSAPAYFQMSLFPTVEEQVERIAQTKEEEKRAVSPASGKSAVPEVAEGVIGRALTSGSNEKGSTMRIAAFYQKSPSIGEAAAFLQNEYGTGGKGLTIAGEKYAMWFDKEGIKIAPGRTANIPGATLVTWEQAAGQVSELLEGGIYAAQEILDTARANEYQELAAQLWYLRQDLSEEAVKRGYLPRVSALYGGFPDSTEKIAGLLEEKISRDGFVAELTGFVGAYEADPDLMRFHFHNPQAVLSRLSELDIEPRQFHALEGFEPAKGSFITEDEIDRMFSRGSGVSEGKMRIYSYFMQGHDAKERADFLKNEYGDGGHGRMGYDEWHDSKGIKFTRSDEASGFDGYDTVKMNWNQVQKRIGELIDTGRYLNPKEMAYTSEYEKIQLARSIYAFYYYCPNTPNPGNSAEWDVNAAERDFKPMLDEPKYSAALYEDMVESFATVTPDESRSYSIMQKAIKDMGAYQRGEYSLFTPLPEETLRAERQKREAAKKEAKEKQNAPKKEKEPAGELEAAARALAKKQKGKVKERADGQLAFDFAAAGAEDAGQAGTDLKDTDSSLEQVKAQEEDVWSRYSLGYGSKGNGLTVWNRLEEVHGDYKTIAHIDAERNVKFYDEKLPEIVKAKIRKVAATEQMDMSVTQKVPIFSTPPQIEPEIQAEKKVEAAPAGKSPVEIYREALSMLSDVVRQSSFYSYLRDRETDYDGAAAELDNELGFFINEIAESQPELYDAFQSLPMFRAWMVEDILERTYQDVVTDSRDAIERHTGDADVPEWAKEPEADAEQAVTENPETVSVENRDEISPEESGRTEGKGTGEAKTQDKKKGRTLPELNYRAFMRLFPDFTKENYRAMQFKAGESMMPLHIEAIGNGEISIAHYYRQNGDTMADPEMTFRIDHEKGTLEPLTYQQDSLGLYQQVYPEPGRWIPKLRKDLNRFANQWFHNIEIQNYIPERAVMEADGNRTEISYQDGKPVIQEEPAPVLEETEKGAGTKQEDTNLTPNVEEYLNLKAEHPDKLVGVEVGEYILFYGKDAQAAAPALSAKLLTKEIPGLGETPVTGGKGWQAVVKDLLEHGQSVVIARPDPERGENAPYEIVKERDIADYIPLGMKLTIDGRHMEVDSIDYENGRVSLKDLDMQGWFPIFREESVPFVRECVEQEWENSLESGELPEEAPQAEKEAGGQEEETHTLADSADFKEAMRLLEDFCNSEYDDGVVDLGNPEHLEIAFTNTEDEQHDIQVEVNLLEHSISQFFDGVCVDKREYGSIRELIDAELSRLDFDELVRLDASVEKLLDRQGSSELEEAKRLIEDFCLDEYEQDSVDFGNLAKVPLAYGVTDSGGLEVQVNVDLIHFSLSQYVDGKCVEERQYDSLRELIDGELAFLDYDQLIYLEPGIEERLEAELNEKIRWEEMQGAREGVTPTEWETTGREEEEPPDMVEIEGGEIVTEGPAEGYSTGLPYDIVIEKLHFGPERHNFHITDDALGTGGQKAKYQDNLAAIRTLTQIEAENRLATEQEQEVLSRYVGWGGLSQAFDADNEKWGKEYTELKELLTPAEYESARSTVLNAHYTSPIVIKAMYEAVKRMDFTPGNILEPSCGIGNFFGLVPEEFEKSNLYGVELDSLTGRIAKQLYQKAEITVGGFETTEHPNDFFDLAVGNVPFGEYKVHDKQYDKQNLLIHDYFLTKTLDKVRPGGVVAFITSKGTMDKANGKVREALAQKADLLGAVRLPNNAFKANAGTDVTADILFFQKRGSAPEKLPDWVNVGQTEDGIPINNYYLQNPDMVLGKMAFWENMYGNATETACVPLEGADLKEQLAEAVIHIRTPDRELLHMDAPEQAEEEKAETIPADPNVRNFSFTEKGGKLYFRENSRMKQIEVGKTPAARIRGMIAIRDSARRLIDLQLSGAEDAEIGKEQAKLNALYDNFQKKYGLLGSAGNRLAFRQDSSYPLLCSLEVLDEEGNLKRKADMFTKRTIQHRQPVTSVDTAVEALGVSIGERACVDLGFMASLMGGGDKIPQIISDLKGIIFKDPDSGPAVISEENTDWHKGWQTADEYLSGDVRRKLEKAKKAAEEYPEFSANVEALLAVQPKDLTAPEISVRIGAPWIDTKYYKQFLFELLQTPGRLQNGRIDVLYSDVTGEWRIKGKSEDSITNTRVHTTYGTKRINAYEIFEASLNQRSVQIFDTHRDADGKEIRVLNEKETAIAQQKQDAMKEAFHDWIFKDPERRTDLCAVYNRMFNSTRPREYDGRHINFIGMNPEIKLEPHQRNAVARILYGGNTLLAHVVGAGKTYEMIAAAMESKRLGLCKKSIMVVPNHLTEQWGGDFLTLYPGAKVLVATKKDFEPKNRKRFCARIATGDYDAVIIGHSQFEKIPISPERQMAIIQDQIDEIVFAIAEAKANREEKFTVKQMEKTKKNLEAKIKKLYDKKKDDTVTFEELGVDRLFVDEAHSFKNLYMHTKMRNVAGISQTDAQKSSDMFAKCRYMDEITGGRGVVFATGTPVSNSMVELYTMMRYLQYSMLEDGYRDSTGKIRSLKHFDNWAATFGEQVTAVELKPEGTGFRLKTRFARFYNLPELINRWKEAADIQTADMLKLPVPEAEYVTVQTEPSEAQKAMVKSLADRAEKIRKEKIDPRIDNMLKITSDGRKLALDQRIMNPLLPDDPGSKVNACVDNVFRIWQESAETKGTQLIFSDLSTPKGKAEPKKEEAKENTEGTETEAAATEEETAMEASVYEDIRKKLIAKGIPPQEIAFIHDANTETQKAELFAKVRNGQVRVLLGSTQKMGAGTNVQTKLVASHDLDCPWRPADLEQRAGRIVRRGNENDHVKIYRYVTKGTFDAYTWGLVESKQKFIGQIMTSKSPARSIEDVDATALSYAEVKMLATGDVRIKEKMDLDIQVTKLKMLKSNHQAQQYEMQDKVRGYYPNKIKETQLYIDCLNADLPVLEAHPVKEDAFSMTVMGNVYTERKEAGKAIVAACRLMDDPGKEIELGEYRGFPMKLMFDGAKFKVTMKQHLTHTAELSDDVVGNITRINNALEKIPQSLANHKENMARLHKELESAKEEAERPFAQEAELQEKSARLAELNTVLDNEEKGRGTEPPRETEEDAERGNEKPSILKTLKEYERPAPANFGAERGQEREAI